MKQLDTPILFIIFNKLDYTKRVFAEIRSAKPKELFIVADGPRNDKEKNITDKVRKYVLDNIDWPCKVRKTFRGENLGGNKSSVDGLDWFFENVEYGIFLEDDCVPSKSFFRYHQELLLKYKDNDKVKAIAGVYFLPKYKMEYSYLFSGVYFSCWGFSTWRRAWGIDRKEIEKGSKGNLKKMFPNFFHRVSVKRHLNNAFKGGITNWDYLFAVKNAMRDGLVIVPKVNLIENIGFEGDSVHSFSKTDKKYLGVKCGEIGFPLKHPKKIEDNEKFNRRINLMLLKKYLNEKITGLLK